MLGRLDGVDPLLKGDVIVVGAHIDHLGVDQSGATYYGADDNASGAAVVSSLRECSSVAPCAPSAPSVFAEFNAEEMGLLGSKYYVKNPPLPLDQTIAMYNFDMVGAGDGTGVLLFGGLDAPNQLLSDLMTRATEEDGLGHVIQFVPQKLASDHAPFVRAGSPSVGVSRAPIRIPVTTRPMTISTTCGSTACRPWPNCSGHRSVASRWGSREAHETTRTWRKCPLHFARKRPNPSRQRIGETWRVERRGRSL